MDEGHDVEVEYGAVAARAGGRRRRVAWRAATAALMGALGVTVAALSVGGPTPAAGDPPVEDVWIAAELGEDCVDVSVGNPADNYPLEYKLDDGRIYLRGSVGCNGPVTRFPSDQGGPWTGEIFQLPCGYRPAHTTLVASSLNDAYGREAHDGGIGVKADGTVMWASFGIPVFEVDDVVMSGTIATANGDFEADNPEVCDEGPPPTSEPEETTTTTEP